MKINNIYILYFFILVCWFFFNSKINLYIGLHLFIFIISFFLKSFYFYLVIEFKLFLLCWFLFILMIIVFSILFIFFGFFFSPSSLLTLSNFIKVPIFQTLEDEYIWGACFKPIVSDSIWESARGVLFLDILQNKSPSSFDYRFMSFFSRLIFNTENNLSVDMKNRYQAWPLITVLTHRRSILQNRRFYLLRKGNFGYFYNNNVLDFWRKKHTFYLKHNLFFLNSIYNFIFFRRSYAIFLAKQYAEAKLKKTKDRFGDKLYEHLLLRDDHKMSKVVRLKDSSVEKFKDIVSNNINYDK